MNESLRRAMLRARLSEEDVASRLVVDPKTVRRWVDGRVPYPRHRLALADMLLSSEHDLWPDLAPVSATASYPAEIVAVYPHRWAVSRDSWLQLFDNARNQIDILAYSSLFLAEDSGLLDTIAARARAGVEVRMALGDPDCLRVSERGMQEGIDDAMAAKIRNAFALYRPLRQTGHAEVRLHRTVLYNSIYRADDDMLVNQHAYGIPAAHAPVFHLHRNAETDMFGSYLASFDRIWDAGTTAP
jgi:phosphatidylserine/phosphatidylglycerophosphate/cardiolipin synthase-like enzyme